MAAKHDGDVFRAISDPTRRAILDLLRARGEQPVTELADPFRMSLSALSQHLRVLRDAGLVAQRTVGRQHLYTLKEAPLREVTRWAAAFHAKSAK